MGINIDKIKSIIGNPESNNLEYKSVLPDSHTLAKYICAFSNTEGGVILIGFKEAVDGKIHTVGISKDFNASQILYKAIEVLNPKPIVDSGYIKVNDKEIFAIDVSVSQKEVFYGQLKYYRNQDKIMSSEEKTKETVNLNTSLDKTYKQMLSYAKITTVSLKEFFNSIKNYIYLLNDAEKFTEQRTIIEKLVFSATADNFEKYLSDLLYEIYLAQPSTLKNDAKILSTKEVLDCDDMTAFIEYLAKKKIYSLGKGSIKGFLKDNKQISTLEALSKNEEDQIEKILQIRHLFTHRNGIVDEKFNRHYSNSFRIGEYFKLSINEISEYMLVLIDAAANISRKAIEKFNLNIDNN